MTKLFRRPRWIRRTRTPRAPSRVPPPPATGTTNASGTGTKGGISREQHRLTSVLLAGWTGPSGRGPNIGRLGRARGPNLHSAISSCKESVSNSTVNTRTMETRHKCSSFASFTCSTAASNETSVFTFTNSSLVSSSTPVGPVLSLKRPASSATARSMTPPALSFLR